jgi:hypothetical protein
MSATPSRTLSKRYVAAVVVGVVVFVAAACLALYFFIATLLKDSDAYQMAVAKLMANSEATQLLGLPVEPGLPAGNISLNNDAGKARLAIPVQGSKAKGTVYLEATKSAGEWRFDYLELELEGSGKRIDLEPASIKS